MATTTSTRRKARAASSDQPAGPPLSPDAPAAQPPAPAPRPRRRRAAVPSPASAVSAADGAPAAETVPLALADADVRVAVALPEQRPVQDDAAAGAGADPGPGAAADAAASAQASVAPPPAPPEADVEVGVESPRTAPRRPRQAQPVMLAGDAAAGARLARDVLALLTGAGLAPAADADAGVEAHPAPAPRPARAERTGRSGRRDRSSGPHRPNQPDRADQPDQPTRQARSAAPAPAPEAAPAPSRAAAAAVPSGPAHSAVRLLPGAAHRIVWQPGHACPPQLQAAAAAQVDGQQQISPENDAALPLLLRLAQAAGHALVVDAAVWPHLAAHRDARTRLAWLEAAYPGGPGSPALAGLLRAPLAPFQAEGALYAAVAGRALLADERGLGKSVTALAAATLMQRHFGVQRVLLVCAAAEVGAWQRAWQRFAPPAAGQGPVLHVEGGLHQRQALWSRPASVRILAPEALVSDAAHLAQWAPGLVIVDEPQRLGLGPAEWAALDAPQALVLCGAALAEQPALMHQLVDWLDVQRLGPLAALQELQAAADQGLPLDEAAVDRLSASLSRLMLQRSRADVAGQLPPMVHSERLLTLAPAQRECHDAALVQARQLMAGWQATGYLADADQWRLLQALQAMHRAALRVQPALVDSALAEPVLQALAAQWDDWCGTAADGGDADDVETDEGDRAAGFQAVLICDSEADRAQLAARLPGSAVGAEASADAPAGTPRLWLAGPDTALPDRVDAVLQLGVTWRTRRTPLGARAPAGQQWVSLVGQGSLDAGLFDTLALRGDLPHSLLDGGRGFLQGDRLRQWLQAVQAALAAISPAA